MAFAVHINMKHCTSCNNCVVACPVDTYGILQGGIISAELVSPIEMSITQDVSKGLGAGCGVCVQACPYGVIRCAGMGNHLVPGVYVQ